MGSLSTVESIGESWRIWSVCVDAKLIWVFVLFLVMSMYSRSQGHALGKYIVQLNILILWVKLSTDSIFLIFPQKEQDLTFHADCFHWRQIAWNVKSCFLGRNKKDIANLSSAKLVQIVVIKKLVGLMAHPVEPCGLITAYLVFWVYSTM